jgi:hypothetical protein
MLQTATKGGIKGVNVLPSPLDWKGKRDPEARCVINPKSRWYFDVLTYRLHEAEETDVRVAFQIREADTLTDPTRAPRRSGPFFPLVWEKEIRTVR